MQLERGERLWQAGRGKTWYFETLGEQSSVGKQHHASPGLVVCIKHTYIYMYIHIYACELTLCMDRPDPSHSCQVPVWFYSVEKSECMVVIQECPCTCSSRGVHLVIPKNGLTSSLAAAAILCDHQDVHIGMIGPQIQVCLQQYMLITSPCNNISVTFQNVFNSTSWCLSIPKPSHFGLCSDSLCR